MAHNQVRETEMEDRLLPTELHLTEDVVTHVNVIPQGYTNVPDWIRGVPINLTLYSEKEE